MQMNSSNFDAGDIVIIDFRYADLEGSKVRPALIITPAKYNRKTEDAIVLKITSAERQDDYCIPLNPGDLQIGHLKKQSIIRADFPLVIEQKLIQRAIGKITSDKLNQVKRRIRQLYDL